MTEFAVIQREAVRAAAEAGDAGQVGRILAHMQHYGCTAAEVSRAAEVAADQLMYDEAVNHRTPDPAVRRVVALFLDDEAEQDARWLDVAGVEADGRPGFEQPPAFDDPENEELFGGVQRIFDEVIRTGEEHSTYGAYRVASAMLARGEITEDDRDTMLDFAVDEKYEERPWGAWIDRARQRVADEARRDREAG